MEPTQEAKKKPGARSARCQLSAVSCPLTIDDVEQMMAAYATADAARRKITAQLDAEITRLREKYAPALDRENERCDEAEEQIASWAELNKEAFGEKRSMVLTHGTIGWRLGNPAVKLRARVRAEAALERVRANAPEFIRRTEELDKQAILAAYAARGLTDAQLEPLGLRITQTERFFVEPKTEEN